MTAIKLAVSAVLISLLGWAAACGDDEDPNGSPSPTPIPQAELPLLDPWEVHIAAADGSGETMVYTNDRASGFAWSPDGSQLAIAAGDFESTTVVRFIGLDGEESASVTVDGSAGRLSWSPDGQYVAAVFADGVNNSLVALASDGSSQRELLREPGSTFILPAVWLPGGELLIEKGQSIGGAQLLAVDVGSGASRELAALDIYPDFFGPPAVSPDGRLLAVTVQSSGGRPCGSPDNGSAIWTIDLETGATTQVLPGVYCGGGSMAMAWSPDGTQIAFSALISAGSPGLYIADLASHEARQLTKRWDSVVAWSEDGTILALQQICVGCDAGPGIVVAIDSESGELQELTENGPTDISRSGQIVAVGDAIEILDATGAQIRVLAPVEALWRYTSFEWSPDEAHVAYQRYHATGQHVYELNADGSGFELVGAYEVATAALSPDGFRVAYLDPPSTKDSGGRLFLAKRDGADPVAVEVPNVHSFSWSPPGGPLLFTALEAPGAETSIYVVNGDGSGLRKIETSSTVSIGSHPAVWAPNGKLVAFADRDIQVVDVDTGEVNTLAQDVLKALPAWSSDSTKLVYGRGFFGRNGSEIVILNADGSGSTTILSDDRLGKNGLVFSPDGTRIAFYTSGSEKNTRLVVANIDGSDERVIAEGALLASTSVAWSPDGQWIAVAMGLDSGRGLFLIKPDGSEVRQLTRGGPIDDIKWQDEASLRFTTFQAGL